MPKSIFAPDDELVSLHDRLTTFAARIKYLTGWDPRDYGPRPAPLSEEVRDLLREFQKTKDEHAARFQVVDRKRLSRFATGNYADDEERILAELWWMKRY